MYEADEEEYDDVEILREVLADDAGRVEAGGGPDGGA